MLCLRRAGSARVLQCARPISTQARVLGAATRIPSRPRLSPSFAPLLRRFASGDASEDSASTSSKSQTSASDTTVGSIIDAAAEKAHEAKEAVKGAFQSTGSNTIFVGNLYFGVTAERLKEECARFGEVVACKIIEDERGLSRGFGFVEFPDNETALKVAEVMRGRYLEGRQMSVDFAKRSGRTASRPRNPTQTLFVGNMSPEMTDADISEIFRDVENVTDIRVAIDRRTGQARGFVHADFVTVEDCIKAKELLTGKSFYGTQLKLDYGFYRPPGSNARRPAGGAAADTPAAE